MKNIYDLIYEGKAKKVFSHEDEDKVIIEFKDDATAFNALKKAQFEGKGKLNCLISARLFELLIKNNIPTHFIELKNENTMVAKKIKVIPLEIVLRNTAYGSLCKQTTIKSVFKKLSLSTNSVLLSMSIFILSHLLILSDPALPGMR